MKRMSHLKFFQLRKRSTPFDSVSRRTLRLSGLPTQLELKATHRRVRSRRVLDYVGNSELLVFVFNLQGITSQSSHHITTGGPASFSRHVKNHSRLVSNSPGNSAGSVSLKLLRNRISIARTCSFSDSSLA